jgi:predicted transcriptional regulator
LDVQTREIVRHLSASRETDEGPTTIELARAVRDHTSATAIAEAHETSRRKVYRALDPLIERGFVESENGVRWTAAGERLLGAFEVAEAAIGRGGVAYLVESEHRLPMLRALRERALPRRALAGRVTQASRTTVSRALSVFEEHDWVRDENGEVEMTSSGREAATHFEELLVATEQAATKAPLLAQLDMEFELQLSVLAGTELVTESGDDPFALLEASIEAADIRGDGVGHVRSVVPFFSSVMFSEFESLVDRQTTFEVIYTSHAYEQLTRPRNVRYLAVFLLAPNVDVRVYPERVTWGLSLYDETVMLASSIDVTDQAAVVGATSSFTGWANETFDELWARSETPSSRFKRWVGRTVSLSRSDHCDSRSVPTN